MQYAESLKYWIPHFPVIAFPIHNFSFYCCKYTTAACLHPHSRILHWVRYSQVLRINQTDNCLAQCLLFAPLLHLGYEPLCVFPNSNHLTQVTEQQSQYRSVVTVASCQN